MHTHKLTMPIRTRRARHPHEGFTLVEIAIALLVVTLLAGGAIGAIQVQLRYTKSSQTREQIREAREALFQYAVANGMLPCPAVDSGGTALATCPEFPRGLLPWRTLGLPATDPWGQTLRYALSVDFAAPGFTYATPGALNILSGGTDLDSASPKSVAFSLWSTGEDASDATAATGNAFSVVAETPGSDDIVEWTSRYVLLAKMMNAGRLVPLGSASSGASSSAAASSAASS